MRRPSSLDLTRSSLHMDESTEPLSTAPPGVGFAMALQMSSDKPDHNLLGHAELLGHAPKVYSPPPHIAARLLYRPTNQSRRKESAASSRRNSLSSSTHSLANHGTSRHRGPQSKHIAQHLRRASIIEDRKARLADRAAHAEKVRLRAALAKAASRDTSLSEERALAAAQAREKNLAEIAATCAEEVKRAKAIAESTKEKREQELRKMRLQMEERLAEAERRRDQLRSRNAERARARGRERGSSITTMTRKPELLVDLLPQVAEVKERDASPLPHDVAVAKIQSWWRWTRRRHHVNVFTQLGLNIDSVRATSFNEVTSLLAQERVLLATTKVLRICGLREGNVGSVNEMAAVRTFLSAFLILGHPAHVLSSKEGSGGQEQGLVGKARDLLISFENILSRLGVQNRYTPPPTLIPSLSEIYATFYNAFIAWKARDSSALIDLMLMQFVELDSIWQTVKDQTDGSVDEMYRQSIKENQLMLMVRIKRLAGPQKGKKLVFDAVKKVRQARAKKPTGGDTKPRSADHAMSTETAMGDLGASDHREPPSSPADRVQQTATPPPTPPHLDDHHPPPVQVKVHMGGIKGILPDNRIVVHEISINKDYRISADEYREQQEQILGPLFRQMRASMEAGNQDAHFFLLLNTAKYIRDKLQRLVKPGSLHTLIGELLDTEVAQRQFAMGSFSYEKFFYTMGSLLPKLCAPVRDEEVKQLVEEKLDKGHYVDRLEALMGFLDIMVSDHANFLLELAKPQLIASAATYEAKIFAAGLETGHYDLSAAEAAWRSAQDKVVAEAAKRDPEEIMHPRSRPSVQCIYNQMLVDIFTQLSPISAEEMPEMLRLDHGRAVRSGEVTRHIATAGAILLQCKNLLKRDVRSLWKTEAARVIHILEANESCESTIDGVMAALQASRSMPAATQSHLRALVAKVITASHESAQSRAACQVQDPVMRLLYTRFKGHVFSRLAVASASEKVRATSTAAEKLAGLGMAEFVDRVRNLIDEIAKVGVVDREAHAHWWELVAEKMAKVADVTLQASSNTTA